MQEEGWVDDVATYSHSQQTEQLQTMQANRCLACSQGRVKRTGTLPGPMALPEGSYDVWIGSSARPPRVSITRRIETIPAERQADKLVFNFL